MQKHSYLWENTTSIHAWIYLNLLDFIHWVSCRKKYFLDWPLPLCFIGDFAPRGRIFPVASAPIGDCTETWWQELLSLCIITPQHGPSSPVSFTLGPCLLSPTLFLRCFNCRQRHYERQRLVQLSVRPLSYSSFCLRPESSGNPTGLGLYISKILVHNWVKQLVIPIARKHERDDKERLIYDCLVSERCSILFNK